jgi:serine/threonine protein kinase
MAQVAAGASLAVDCPKLANGRFIIKAKLGNGSFGDIFAGVDTWNSMDVAIKLEHVKARHPQLQYEARVYKLLHASGQAIGIPNMYWAGTEGDYHAMVMDLCGPCLEDLFTYCGRIFTMKTTLQLADQLLHRIQHMHTHHFLHRDIKPENFVMGTGSRAHHVNIVDFGLSKRFFDPKLHQHIPYKEGKPLTGTARYCSVSTHLGVEQGRRDDLEAIGFLLVYFAKGSLPWQGLKVADQGQKTARIGEKKIATTLEYLCKDLPNAFLRYLRTVRALKFEETPDYDALRGMFADVFRSEGYRQDYIFDWVEIRRAELEDAHGRDASTLGTPHIASSAGSSV